MYTVKYNEGVFMDRLRHKGMVSYDEMLLNRKIDEFIDAYEDDKNEIA